MEASARAATGSALLVDDDPAIRRDYGRLLRRLNLAVQTATNGADALEWLARESFDVAVVVDIAVPGIGGVSDRGR